MIAPLLTTKLYIPPVRPDPSTGLRARLVPRPRLIERLNTGVRRKLTLVSAPAGFGKTTLVSEWVQALGGATPPIAIAWLSLDESDNDPIRFLSYFVAALQTTESNVGQGALNALQSPQPPPAEAILTALINEIAALPGRIVLVLDDYHVVESSPVDAALTFLLDHLPPQMHLVIATREDPQLPLARLRARGQLAELRATDLRFSSSEAAEFLNQAMDLNLAAEDIAALETRTEGWIAGLQLAAFSMQGQPDAAGFIKSFTGSHRFVLDYLVEEVLHRQPSGVQTFLLHTAILDRLCGPLCDAVLRDPAISGQATLDYLDHANLFIVPLDNERRWYRYHHLFGGFLRQRLGQSLPPGDVAELHIRASQWYEENGYEAAAFHHAVAAGDFARAADLAEVAWSATFRSYIQNTLFLDWMKALPDPLIRARPVLSAGYAWALLDIGALEAAKARLQDAERGLEATGNATAGTEAPATARVVVDQEEFRALPATIAIARAYLALAHGDGAATVRLARQALALTSEADHFRRAGVTALLGLVHLSSGDLDAAAGAMIEGMKLTHMAGSSAIALTGTFPLADIRIVQGRLHEAERVYARSLQLAMAQGEASVPGIADLHLGLSQVYLERGDLETAGQHLQKSAALDAQARSPDWAYRACLARARFQEVVGDLDGALDLFHQAERLYYKSLLPDLRPLAALKARVWVRQGQLAEALAWVQEQALSAADDLSFLREFEHITLVRVLLARCRRDRADTLLVEALDLLERLRQAAEAGRRFGNVIEILVLQALAHQMRGDFPLALPPLERALALAEPEGYVRIFVDEGPPMAALLQEAAKQGIAPNYVSQLWAALGDAKDGTPVTQPLIEPLSERELDVLRLLETELNGPEIARELVVSLNTLRTHTKSIYNKLGVHNRRAAVRRAEELDLL